MWYHFLCCSSLDVPVAVAMTVITVNSICSYFRNNGVSVLLLWFLELCTRSCCPYSLAVSTLETAAVGKGVLSQNCFGTIGKTKSMRNVFLT